MKFLLALTLFVGFGSAVSSQRDDTRRAERSSITGAEVRALTKSAQSAARGDKDEFILGLDARVRARWGDFESFPITLIKRDDLRIILSAPYMTYRRTLAEYLRINRPVPDVPWIDAVVVLVEPSRIDAPDVTRVIVERGGQEIAPTENLLRPMTFANGNGGEAIIHAGEVRFPVAAFAAGGSISVTATPAVGAPLVASLSDAQLKMLK